jgi:hypothetical protein
MRAARHLNFDGLPPAVRVRFSSIDEGAGRLVRWIRRRELGA